MRRYLLICLLLIVVSILPVSAQEGDNLLQNGGFEGTYVAIGGDPSLMLAPGWQPWSLRPPAGSPSSVNLRPDYKPAPSNRIRSGNAAQGYETFFATHDGGIYQRVPVTNGADLRFSVFLYVWSSATFADPNESIQPQNVDVQVGIDPTGGQDGASDDIIWSESVQFYDEYRELSVTATAESNAVTVFVRTRPQGAIGVNNVYVDDARLVQIGQTGPTVTTVPDNNPTPTSEGDGTELPDETDVPDTTDVPSQTETAATATTRPTNTQRPPTSTATGGPTAIPSEVAPFPNRLTHTVVAGDTVIDLAVRYNSSSEAIIVANGLNESGFIVIGQQLVIPVPAGTGQPAQTATPTRTPTTIAPTATSRTPVPGTGGTPIPSGNAPGTHTVRVGENLFRIAIMYNTTVEALATLNNISNPNLVYAGTVLRVPTNTPTNPGGGTGGTGRTHVVQVGENAFRIAIRYGITVEELAQANRLSNPNLIFVGQNLIIPQ